MLEPDADAADPTVSEQVSDLLTYLSAGAREVGPSPVRDVRNHDVTIWSEDMPEHSAVTIGTAAHEAWMEVRRVAAPAVLPVPVELRQLLGVGEHLTDPDPRPRALPDKILAEAEQRVKDDLGPPNRDDTETWAAWSERAHQVRSQIAADVETWLRETWTPWASRTRPAFEARALYSELYDLHLKEDADSATHEVVWGHLLLSWRGETASVHTPVLTTPVSIEVDPTSAAIRVIPEKPLELELDALEGTGLPGLDGLVRLQSEIRDLPPDPWDADSRQQARWQIIAPLGVDAELHESTNSVAPSCDVQGRC